MPTIALMSKNGQKVGDVDLRQDVFGVEPNMPLMHQAVVEELANLRSGTADTKTRGDVAGGGKKPYRQKGTGRARQGSIRAPHYPGGGTVFGPHPRSYEQRMPRKMRRAALRSAISTKVAGDQLVIVDELTVDSISTKAMVEIMKNLNASGKVLIAITDVTDELIKSVRNIPGVMLRVAPALSVSELLDSDRVVMTKAAAQVVEEAFSK
ncbi:MAG TPA: 50S ribosomal protein L4 [Armatimonadota bacterium]|nr:50S ribosomal protein L4 [Armatimonadota bacterium]